MGCRLLLHKSFIKMKGISYENQCGGKGDRNRLYKVMELRLSLEGWRREEGGEGKRERVFHVRKAWKGQKCGKEFGL